MDSRGSQTESKMNSGGSQTESKMKCRSLSNLVDMAGSNTVYIGVLCIQLVYAGRAIFTKEAVSKGINPYIFVFYRQVVAFTAVAPFAFFLESNKSPPLSLKLLCKIFFVSLVGITLSLNLDTLSMDYASATFCVAISNTGPAITFIMAVLLRMESISMKRWPGIAKVVGSAVSILGATMFILVKGPPIYHTSHKESSVSITDSSSKGDWLKGSLTAISSNVTWAAWTIMQEPILKEYPAKIRLTALQTFFSCIQTALWAVAVDRKPSAWKLGWDIKLLSIIYCGALYAGLTYWMRIWVIDKKGPVFLAISTPLGLVFTAFFSAILWNEALHWGSACGAVVLVGGLYSYLWGKNEEDKAKNLEQQKPAAPQETLEQQRPAAPQETA